MKSIPKPLPANASRALIGPYRERVRSYTLSELEKGKSEKEIVAEFVEAGHHHTTRYLIHATVREWAAPSAQDRVIASIVRILLALPGLVLILDRRFPGPVGWIEMLLGAVLMFAAIFLVEGAFTQYWWKRKVQGRFRS